MCRYPYTRTLTLTNDTHLPCKCEVLGQEQRSQGLATFTTATTSGLIPAKGTLDVEVTLQALRLGRIQLPLQVKVRLLLLGPACVYNERQVCWYVQAMSIAVGRRL